MARPISHSVRIGQRVNHLTVLRRVVHKGLTSWICRCDCGRKTGPIANCDMGRKRIQSCGCLKLQARLSHGNARLGKITVEYRAWRAMKNRCLNKRGPAYDDYGGRGITVCKRWEKSFQEFLSDMGRRPSAQHSLDRVDNNKGYRPSNVRWATKKQQASNRRPPKR